MDFRSNLRRRMALALCPELGLQAGITIVNHSPDAVSVTAEVGEHSGCPQTVDVELTAAKLAAVKSRERVKARRATFGPLFTRAQMDELRARRRHDSFERAQEILGIVEGVVVARLSGGDDEPRDALAQRLALLIFRE